VWDGFQGGTYETKILKLANGKRIGSAPSLGSAHETIAEPIRALGFYNETFSKQKGDYTSIQMQDSGNREGEQLSV